MNDIGEYTDYLNIPVLACPRVSVYFLNWK